MTAGQPSAACPITRLSRRRDLISKADIGILQAEIEKIWLATQILHRMYAGQADDDAASPYPPRPVVAVDDENW